MQVQISSDAVIELCVVPVVTEQPAALPHRLNLSELVCDVNVMQWFERAVII